MSRIVGVGLEQSGATCAGLGVSGLVRVCLGWSGCAWTDLKVPKLWIPLIILSFLFSLGSSAFSRVPWGKGWYVAGCGGGGMRG